MELKYYLIFILIFGELLIFTGEYLALPGLVPSISDDLESWHLLAPSAVSNIDWSKDKVS